MDRVIPEQKKRMLKMRKVAWSISLPLLLAISFILFRSAIKPHLSAANLETSVVALGPVVETISTSGTVELKKQFTILAPSTTVLKRIVTGPGQKVNTGDTLLILDPAPIHKLLREEIYQLKKLKVKKLHCRIKIDIMALDQQFQLKGKTSEISRLQSELEDQQAQLSFGGTSSSKVSQAFENVLLAEEEYNLLVEKEKLQSKEMEIELTDIDAEIMMTELRKSDIHDQLAKMIMRAPVPGVVVEIDGETGSLVTADKMLVKISDLRTYKITGSISDNFSDKISIGGKVEIIIDKENRLGGMIGNIRPIVKEGQVLFEVFPENSSYPRFRPNLNVEIKVVVAERENTLRVKDGPFFDGAKKLRVYKIVDQTAIATEVSTGLFNMDYIEIIDGLQEGDEIVISDVSSVKVLDEVEIRE